MIDIATNQILIYVLYLPLERTKNYTFQTFSLQFSRKLEDWFEFATWSVARNVEMQNYTWTDRYIPIQKDFDRLNFSIYQLVPSIFKKYFRFNITYLYTYRMSNIEHNKSLSYLMNFHFVPLFEKVKARRFTGSYISFNRYSEWPICGKHFVLNENFRHSVTECHD